MSNNKRRVPSDLAEYGNAGIQMVLIIGVFVLLGRYLDGKTVTDKPWWTMALAIFGVIISVLFMVRKFGQISRKK